MLEKSTLRIWFRTTLERAYHKGTLLTNHNERKQRHGSEQLIRPLYRCRNDRLQSHSSLIIFLNLFFSPQTFFAAISNVAEAAAKEQVLQGGLSTVHVIQLSHTILRICS